MIPTGFLQDLLSRVDIVDIVGRHVELKKAGANLMGLCPFHGEKSPSFSVSPSKQFYHCFGCGAHGDAIRFLTEYSGMGFIEAIQELAQGAGMTVPAGPIDAAEQQRALQNKARQASLGELLARAAGYYRDQLKTHANAVDYLKRRGLSGETAKRFELGFAPPGWRSLASAFARYDDPLLVEAGLVIVQGEEGAEQKRYDRFRERIMFPIRSVKGEVIGFGARVLDGGEPKYLNSPETPVFIKGQELYGLFEARAAIRAAGHALVVEGYMDVVALAQSGIANAVATLGTACTAEHIGKLFRFTDSVVFSFDGDGAGRRAASRALEACLPFASDTRSVRFLFLPSEHDPDSYVREHGSAGFAAALAGAVPLSRQLLERAREDCDLATAEGRARMLAVAKPLWSALPASGMLKGQVLIELAGSAGVTVDDLQQSWGGNLAHRAVRQAPPQRPALPGKRLRGLPDGPADQALRMLLRHGEWWEQLGSEDHDLLHGLAKPHGELFGWLERELHEHGAQPWSTLRETLAHNETHVDLAQRLMGSMAADDVVDFADLRAVINLLWRQHWSQRSEALAVLAAADPAARSELQDVLARLRALAAAQSR